MAERRIKYIFAGATLLVTLVLPLGCSSKDTPKAESASMEIERMETEPQNMPATDAGSYKDTLQTPLVSPSKHGSVSGFDTSVNPYYDKGYQQGQEDGYDDGYEVGFDDGYADNDLPSEEEE